MTLKISHFSSLIIVLVPVIFLPQLPALADAISPAITGGGRAYSNEEPNSSFYGTGVAGRLAEASALRFEGEQETVGGNFDSAMPKLAKAVQLDPADPSGHLLYAHSMTGKINSSSENPDPTMLNLAIHEWKLLWRHDADLSEQQEARQQAGALMKMARRIAREEEKARQAVAAKDQAGTQ